MTLLGNALCLLGAGILVLAGWGLVRLPDALSRQHAATKAGTLALFSFTAGAACLKPEPAWAFRLLLLLIVLFITLPLASHALARAAMPGPEDPQNDDTQTH